MMFCYSMGRPRLFSEKREKWNFEKKNDKCGRGQKGLHALNKLTRTLSGPKSFVQDIKTEKRSSSGIICQTKKLHELKGSVGSKIGLDFPKEEMDTKWVLRPPGDIVI